MGLDQRGWPGLIIDLMRHSGSRAHRLTAAADTGEWDGIVVALRMLPRLASRPYASAAAKHFGKIRGLKVEN